MLYKVKMLATLDKVEVGDIVFCKVKAKGDRGVLIGNNHGKINGWLSD